MDVEELEGKLKSLLKGQYATLSISFNEQHINYQDAADYYKEHNEPDVEPADWISEEEREKAMKDDSVWMLMWYPDTPIGSYGLLASSLNAVVDAALEQQKKDA